jgi:hypothetical protein
MMENGAELKKAIDDRSHEIIEFVKLFAKQSYEIFVKDKNGGKKQFTELVTASAQACCVEEFKLYITYKGSKKGTEGLWKNLSNKFNKIIDDLMLKVADDIKKDDEAVRLEVLKRFCGYLMWREHADLSEQGGK